MNEEGGKGRVLSTPTQVLGAHERIFLKREKQKSQQYYFPCLVLFLFFCVSNFSRLKLPRAPWSSILRKFYFQPEKANLLTSLPLHTG